MRRFLWLKFRRSQDKFTRRPVGLGVSWGVLPGWVALPGEPCEDLRVALSHKHKVFIDQYMIDFNGSRAAREAGYSSSSSAWELLRNNEVRAAIEERLLERHRRNALTVEKIELMLRNMAEVEPLDIWDEHGKIRPLPDMPPQARQAIKSIKVKTREHVITGEITEELEVELWDKKGATELLGRFRKMFTDKFEVGGEVKAKVSFTITGIGE